MEKITKEKYDAIHPDYKGVGSDGVHRILKLVDGVTMSVPVEIVEKKD